MNKKLLCSTALAGAMIVSGSALAELKIGGNLTNTINFGSDDRTGNNTGSDQRLGSEMNLTLLSKKDLNNGMYIQYKANIEFDDSANDVEYEVQLGTEAFYIGAGRDAGNNIAATPTLPAVGYHVGSLAGNVSTGAALNNDGMLGAGLTINNEANDSAHLSLNAKVAGGLASIIYAPSENNSADDDTASVIAESGGSAMSIIYSGRPVENLNFIIGRNVTNPRDERVASVGVENDEVTTDKIGLSYNFGQIRAGLEYQDVDFDNPAQGNTGAEAMNYAVTFAASDSTTFGIQHSRAEFNDVANARAEEKLTALSLGYNLGGASIAASVVDVEDRGGVNGTDSQGIVITTKFGF